MLILDSSPYRFFEDMKADAHLELLQSHPDGPHFITSTADVVQGWLWKVFLSFFRSF